MRTTCVSFIRRAFSDQRGQVLPLLALGMVTFIAVTGLSVDMGRAYVVRSQLQNAVNAAAMAAASEVYNVTSSSNPAVTVGITYLTLNGITGTVTTKCLTSLLATNGTCTSSSLPANAVKVTAQSTLKTYFMALVGVKTLTVGATAMATQLGATQPWNVAIILDATPSMANTDAYCNYVTAEQCAMNGIQTLLKNTNPCAPGVSSCTPTSANALFRVSLFSFPNILTSQVAYDYNCTATPDYRPYTLPVIPLSTNTSGYKPTTMIYSKSGASSWAGTYQITAASAGNADANGFVSDYYSSTATNNLNPSSILVKAIGNGSTKGCLTPPNSSGTKALGGTSGITYFAAAIYAAQTALQAEQALTTSLGIDTQNAIIFISDGQANTTSNRFPSYTGGSSSIGYGLGDNTVASNGLVTMNTSTGVYPSTIDPCQQAMIAANYAKQMGTRVYGVAYGSETNGCTDSSIVSTADTFNVSFSSTSKVLPCLTMENIASSMTYFYTDGSSIANGCTATANSVASMANIFSAITSTFHGARLLPNNTI